MRTYGVGFAAIVTLSLVLSGWPGPARAQQGDGSRRVIHLLSTYQPVQDRKSTRLNSSHIQKSRMPSSA